MDLSVVVCAHNEERFLPAQLDALQAQRWTGEWEVVVVDNMSSDATADIVREYTQRNRRIRLVQANERASKSYALSVGVQESRAHLLAFCDADDIVAAGWVQAIAAGLEHYEVVTGPHELDLLNPPSLAGSRGRSAEQPVGSFFGIFPAIRGANWGTNKDVWHRLDGMREDYTAGEDMEWSFRCWLEGIQVVGLPDATVHYRYRSSIRGMWKQGLAYGAFRPRIARLLVENDKPRPPRLAGWKTWGLLILRLPSLVTPEGRTAWVWVAANRTGQIVGSLRERTLLL